MKNIILRIRYRHVLKKCIRAQRRLDLRVAELHDLQKTTKDNPYNK